MNKILRAAATAACLVMALHSWGWGQKGHDVTANIAERHLTPATAAAVDSIFQGKSLVYWANWLDNASHTPAYAYSKTWHYLNVDADQTYETMPKNPQGDVVDAIRYNIGVLGDTTNNDPAAKALALKMLVHCVGDMHQPLHMGRKTDLGGNRVKVKYFGRDTNLHSIWDTGIIESAHKWTYSEWVEQIDTNPRAENRKMAEGTPESWGEETYGICRTIYASTPVGSKLSYDYVGEWTGTVEVQLLRGGLRLAAVLNDIFG